jgi:hypothetical protein
MPRVEPPTREELSSREGRARLPGTPGSSRFASASRSRSPPRARDSSAGPHAPAGFPFGHRRQPQPRRPSALAWVQSCLRLQGSSSSPHDLPGPASSPISVTAGTQDHAHVRRNVNHRGCLDPPIQRWFSGSTISPATTGRSGGACQMGQSVRPRYSVRRPRHLHHPRRPSPCRRSMIRSPDRLSPWTPLWSTTCRHPREPSCPSSPPMSVDDDFEVASTAGKLFRGSRRTVRRV